MSAFGGPCSPDRALQRPCSPRAGAEPWGLFGLLDLRLGARPARTGRDNSQASPLGWTGKWDNKQVVEFQSTNLRQSSRNKNLSNNKNNTRRKHDKRRQDQGSNLTQKSVPPRARKRSKSGRVRERQNSRIWRPSESGHFLIEVLFKI